MADEWMASVWPASPGWITVPAGLSERQADAWVEHSLSELRDQWDDQWPSNEEQEGRNLLRAAVRRRTDDEILVLMFWPYPHPIAVRLNVRAFPSMPLTTWVDEGFEIDGFDGAALGPGVRCIAQTDADIAGEQRRVITAQFLFDDGEFQLQVEVEPTFVELYSHLSVEIASLVESLEIRRSAGVPFTPRAVPGYNLPLMDTLDGVGDA